ncbi:MAG: ion transporter [Hyphomicrobium sp.]|nr:ion transporter [Hyphomicrobium sp.]
MANAAETDIVETDTDASALKRRLRHYYTSDTPEGRQFRYGILAFDIVTILFIVLTSFLPRTSLVEVLDAVFGIAILADFSIRIWISRRPLREFMHPATWADIVAIASFLAPIVGEGAGFLRVLRTVRLLRTYHLLKQLRSDFVWFRINEEIALAAINLFVFLFIMTAVVYETQHASNAQINNYVDALYFTVTTLTTTGFGDITLPGTTGRLIAVIIMILGVTLFLNLVRTILQPVKVRFTCPRCGLRRHDTDAVHCKACGEVLNIPDDGAR